MHIKAKMFSCWLNLYTIDLINHQVPEDSDIQKITVFLRIGSELPSLPDLSNFPVMISTYYFIIPL